MSCRALGRCQCPLHQPRRRRRNERSVRPAASESNPANPIAGSGLAVLGRLLGGGGGSGAGAAAGGAGVGSGARGAGRGAAAGAGAGAGAGGFGRTTGTSLNVFTSSSRRLSGSLLVSLSSRPVISTQRPTVASSPIWPFSGYRSSGHRHRGRPCTRPPVRWKRALFSGAPTRTCSCSPPRTVAPRTRHPTAVTCPALFLRQEAPIPSLRVCGFDRHYTESEDNYRCSIKILMGHRRPPVVKGCNNRSARPNTASTPFLLFCANQWRSVTCAPCDQTSFKSARRDSLAGSTR